jgi:hypothetical protein
VKVGNLQVLVGFLFRIFFSSYVGCPASHQFEDSGLNTDDWKLDT